MSATRTAAPTRAAAGRVLRVGTRASLLARTQSGHVADRVRTDLGVEVELVEVTTHGDVNRAPLASMGGAGVFVGALRDALLERPGRRGGALPQGPPATAQAGVELVAVPPREDPRDALVARHGLTLGELPAGSKVGTGSPRRRGPAGRPRSGRGAARIRGNVDTRLRKVAAGEFDAVVLAAAGLARIGRRTWRPRCWTRSRCCPPPGRERWPSSAAATTPTW